MQAHINANHAANEDLLLKILSNQEDIKRIVQYRDAGSSVAERVMEAGQLVSGFILGIRFEVLDIITGTAQHARDGR